MDPASDGRNKHDLIAVLEGIGFAPEKTNVLIIDIDVDEPAKLAILAFDLSCKRRKGLVDIGQQRWKVFCRRVELLFACGVTSESGRKGYFDWHDCLVSSCSSQLCFGDTVEFTK